MTRSRTSLLVLAAATTLFSGVPAFSPSAARSAEKRFSTPLLASVADGINTETASKKQSVWFPTKIQETVDYRNLVQSMYLRHIVLETREMAEIALKQYLDNREVADPFGEAASALSACTLSREEGGKIGWVDPPLSKDDNAASTLLPADVVRALYYDLEPKAGDVHIVQSAISQQFHVVNVEELMIQHFPTTAEGMDDTLVVNEAGPVGTFSGRNTLHKRKKLPGKGVTPELPTFEKYMVQTSGCQMNVADSERLAGVLENDLKMQSTDDSKEADVILFNTCSIRDHAEQKLYDKLGPYAAQKRNGRKLALVVTGCVAQQEGEALLRRVPEIDAVIGPQYIVYLKNVLEKVMDGHHVVSTAPMLQQEPSDFSKPVRGHSVRAWVNVINGCNEHCTYCVVPATRGMEVSRTMKGILNECLDLKENGYKEVTLLGQNIDAYGRDMVPKRTFAELLEYLNQNLPDGMRIRYVTSHPRYFSDRVIDAVADLDKVCECFHMPFQAGDDGVLRNMRRGYSYQSYMRIIEKIRKRAPDASICADVIVGFPGETDEAFEKTLQLMEEVHFDNLNSFAYSPRPNTEAALLEDQIPEEVKAERLQRVQKLAIEHGLERSQRYLGREVEVLVEDANPRNAGQVMGRTRQGRQVYFDGALDQLRGELVNVLITEARTWSLTGELCK